MGGASLRRRVLPPLAVAAALGSALTFAIAQRAEAASCAGTVAPDESYSFSCDSQLGSDAGFPGAYRLFRLYAPFDVVGMASVSSPPGIACGPDGSGYRCDGTAPVPPGTTVAGSVSHPDTPFCNAEGEAGPLILAYWPGDTTTTLAGSLACSSYKQPDIDEEGGSFAVGKAKRNKRAGTARLTIQAPGPGTLKLGGKGIVRRVETVASAGSVVMQLKAVGKARKRLNRTGEVEVRAVVTFELPMPDGSTRKLDETKRVTLIKKL